MMFTPILRRSLLYIAMLLLARAITQIFFYFQDKYHLDFTQILEILSNQLKGDRCGNSKQDLGLFSNSSSGRHCKLFNATTAVEKDIMLGSLSKAKSWDSKYFMEQMFAGKTG
ncbi:hypothetical protein Tco_0045377 [Tanacetum coccineum]